MPDEKDRFGDTLREAERGREDEYFMRRDRELIEKARQHRRPAEAARCPRCGETLPPTAGGGASVATCPRCPPA